MAGLVEAQRVVAAVVAALQADTTTGGVAALLGGRIYRDRAPAGVVLPAATISLASALDTVTLSGVRVGQSVLVDIRVVCDGSSYGPINPTADRVDTMIDQYGGVRDGVRIVKLRRDGVQAFVQDEVGKAYAHLIQTYRTESHAYSA